MKIEVPQFTRTGIDISHRQIIHRYLTHGEARNDREIAHTRSLSLMRYIQDNPHLMKLMKELFVYEDPILETEIAGIKLPNPIIMPAGFDKKVEIHKFLGEALGFGAVTEGTITKIPYSGNEYPRIFDLPNSDGLINRMGFPGDGSDMAEDELKRDNPLDRHYKLLISVGASKPSFDNGTEIEDFISVSKQLVLYGEGQEQNISSPNTKGNLGLQTGYSELAQELNQQVYIPHTIKLGSRNFVILVKLPPDLAREQREKLMKAGFDNGVNVAVMGNTSVDETIRNGLNIKDLHRGEKGGISGQPIREKALENSHDAYIYTGGERPIIMAGGIKTGEDVWNALTYGGASGIEMYTAFVRPNSSTPNFVYYRSKELAKAMRMMGMKGMEDFKTLRGKRVRYPLAKAA